MKLNREYQVYIEGPPAAQPRPKVSKFSVYYTGKAYKIWRELVDKALEASPPEEMMTGPLYTTLKFYIPRPKSHYLSRKYGYVLKKQAPLYHTQKPDLDNLEKLVYDRCNGIVYKDDSQIVRHMVEKVWCHNPEYKIDTMSGLYLHVYEVMQ